MNSLVFFLQQNHFKWVFVCMCVHFWKKKQNKLRQQYQTAKKAPSPHFNEVPKEKLLQDAN